MVRGWWAAALLLALAAVAPVLAADDSSPTETGDRVIGLDAAQADRLQAMANQAFELEAAGKQVQAAAAFDALIGDPAFPQLPLEAHAAIYSLAGNVAFDREDNARARDLYLQAITANSVDSDDWINLAWVEYRLKEHDAAAAHMAEYARRWPDELDDINDSFVFGLLNALDDEAPPRLDLLQSLASAKWNETGAGADYLWFELALLRVQRGERDLARTTIERIAAPRELVQLRSDRRFDGLFDPQSAQFDVERAAQQRLERITALSAQDPKNLELLSEVTDALWLVGGFERILTLVDATLRGGVKDFTQPEYQVWLLNSKAMALQQLGRFDEAIAVMERASRMAESGGVNVSQSINLGEMYCARGNAKQALAALKGVENVSDYGQMALQSVVHCARLQQGDRAGADEALAYLQAHHSRSASLHLIALLREDRLDAAAAALIENLDSEKDRADALVMVQDFLPERLPPADVANDERWESLIRRDDVRAAIDRVGRRQRYEIQQP